jgi:hypothetical protein
VSNSGIVVERAGATLIVRSEGAVAESGAFVAFLPPEPDRTAVVVDRSAAGALCRPDADLVAALHRQVSRGGAAAGDRPPGGLRLLVDGAARPGPGGASLAAGLAHHLGLAVTAPDGPLVMLRGGELFSAGPAAGWIEFGPGRPPVRTGPRYPEPPWQRLLPDRWEERHPGVDVVAVPAGIWLRSPHGGPVSTVDMGYGVPAQPTRMAVVLGAPGEPAVPAPDVAAVLAELPDALLAGTVLVLYGPRPAGEPALGQWLADHLGRQLRVCHAMPHYRADGSAGVSAVDGSARLTWPPLLLESTYHPGRTLPAAGVWFAPLPGLAAAGTGSYWLERDWVVDVIPSGLCIRPAGARQEPAVAALPVDPGWINVVVAVDSAGLPPAVQDRVEWLLRALPSAAAPLRVVATDPVPPALLAGPVCRTRAPLHHLTQTGPAVSTAATRAHPAPAAHRAVAAPGDTVSGALTMATAATSRLPELPRPARRAPQPPARRPLPPAPAAAARQQVVPALPAPATTVPATAVPAPALPAPATTVPATAVPAPALPAPALPATALPAPALPATALPATALPAPALPAPATAVPATATALPATAGGGPGATGPHRPAAPVVPAVPTTAGPPPTGPHVPAPPVLAAVPEPAGVATEPADAALATAGSAGEPWAVADAGTSGRTGSTAQERLRFRLSLGWRYGAAVQSVARLMAERPGLRIATGNGEEAITELVAVRAFAESDQVDLIRAMRRGPGPVDLPYAACLSGGLRRLTVLRGVVVRGGPDDPAAADGYRPGMLVADPAPLIASADPMAAVPGAVELLIWSVTGRRLDGLAEGNRAGEVVFPPGTVFTVLAVDPPAGRGPRRVLLAEADGPGRPERVRERLAAAAAARAAVPPRPADPDHPAAEAVDAARFAELPRPLPRAGSERAPQARVGVAAGGGSAEAGDRTPLAGGERAARARVGVAAGGVSAEAGDRTERGRTVRRAS